MIYKILSSDEWQAARRVGIFHGSGIDLKDGYIHFSASDQVRETAARHFANRTDLVLLAVEENDLGDALKWEVSRGGALFPHLYIPLRTSLVRSEHPLPWNGEIHLLPDTI